jgi:hypothetical protein
MYVLKSYTQILVPNQVLLMHDIQHQSQMTISYYSREHQAISSEVYIMHQAISFLVFFSYTKFLGLVCAKFD